MLRHITSGATPEDIARFKMESIRTILFTLAGLAFTALFVSPREVSDRIDASLNAPRFAVFNDWSKSAYAYTAITSDILRNKTETEGGWGKAYGEYIAQSILLRVYFPSTGPSLDAAKGTLERIKEASDKVESLSPGSDQHQAQVKVAEAARKELIETNVMITDTVTAVLHGKPAPEQVSTPVKTP